MLSVYFRLRTPLHDIFDPPLVAGVCTPCRVAGYVCIIRYVLSAVGMGRDIDRDGFRYAWQVALQILTQQSSRVIPQCTYVRQYP